MHAAGEVDRQADMLCSFELHIASAVAAHHLCAGARKEFGKADAHYMTRGSFVIICMDLCNEFTSACAAGSSSYVHGAGKEYGKADSRYVTRDSFVINMEAVTAFAVGPMCFWAVAAMVNRKSWRHVLQLIISVCQLYGDVLYFATTGTEGEQCCEPGLSTSLWVSPMTSRPCVLQCWCTLDTMLLLLVCGDLWHLTEQSVSV
jgi:hypothetical protein